MSIITDQASLIEDMEKEITALKDENEKLRGLLGEALASLNHFGQDVSLRADIRKLLGK